MRKSQYGHVLMLVIAFTILFSVNGMAKGLLLTQAEVDELFANVTSVTGLPYKEFPAIEVIEKPMLLGILFAETSIITEDIQEDISADQFIMMQICGKYSWLTKKIYIMEEDLVAVQKYWNYDAKTAQKLILIHEMVHALDDQYYGLEHLFTQTRNRDQLMSIGAFIEGHAMYVAKQVYEHMGLDKDAFEVLWSATEGVNMVAELYLAGLRFVTYVLNHQEMSEELLFAKPPLTAHYILNPEWYVQKKPIVYTDLDTAFGKDYRYSLPWNFRYGRSVVSDKLTFYLAFRLLETDERLIDGFLTSWVCTLYEVTPTQVEDLLPPNILTSYQNGYISISILQLTTPEFAERYQTFFKEYNTNQWKKMKEVPEVEESQELEVSFPQLQALYPHSYCNYFTNDEFNIQATYFLDILCSQYLVEVLTMNLEMTEQDLIQVLAEIERRLLLHSSESL